MSRALALASLGWLGCGAQTDGPLTVEIVDRGALRDLEAVSSEPDAEIAWTLNGDPLDVGQVVPASLVTPGAEFSVTAVHKNAEATASITVDEPPAGNVLVLLFDDIGVDHIGAYGINPTAPPTPVIDGLADRGIRFDKAYAAPVCSPTRGILMTGRHSRRNGLGWIADTGTRDYALPLASLTIAEALDDAWPEPWPTSAVGKWHMAAPQYEDVLTHPNDQGFDWFGGSVGNPNYAPGYGYYRWNRNENGVIKESFTYMTTASVDDALARIEVMPEPWFLYVAFQRGPWAAESAPRGSSRLRLGR